MIIFDIGKINNFMFQDSANSLTQNVINFHNFIMMLCVFILFGVLYFLLSSINLKVDYNRKFQDLANLEFWWTIFPVIILFIIAVPSLSLLYKLDEILDPFLNIKVIGNQWYWTYEYDDYKEKIEINSYMVSLIDLNKGDFRLREVDNRIAIPINSLVKVVTTSNDVIHCWTMPSLGIKIDSTPGRLNQIGFISNRSGLMVGGCSEICGSEHAYMPIIIEIISLNLFNNWISTLINS